MAIKTKYIIRDGKEYPLYDHQSLNVPTILDKQVNVSKYITEINQLKNDKTQLTTDLTNKNNEIKTILIRWKVKDLTELSNKIQIDAVERNKIKNDLIQERNKVKQLETQITNKDNEISQKDKIIQSLELKNEKLSESYKKLIQHLADARLLVSHLQNDLQTEKQDKAHIQKELNDALAILNKPTAEMGTQTDLTAEQITQMEKDLETTRQQVNQQNEAVNNLNQQLTNLQTEQTQKEQSITELQTKVKDLVPNEQEKRLLPYCDTSKWNPNNYPNIKKELENWSNLREDYNNMRNELIKVVDLLIQKREIEKQNEQKSKELASKNEQLTQLQTRYEQGRVSKYFRLLW